MAWCKDILTSIHRNTLILFHEFSATGQDSHMVWSSSILVSIQKNTPLALSTTGAWCKDILISI